MPPQLGPVAASAESRNQKKGRWTRSSQVCTRCRQAKNRCDFVERFPEPCSRCASMGDSRPCYVDPTFKRRNIRGERESSDPLTNPVTDSTLTGQPSSGSISSSASPNEPTASSPPSGPEGASPNAGGYSWATQDRTLGNAYLSAAEIDLCFDTFWTHYHPLFPIFMEPFGPEECFEKSNVLFWAMCGAACRPRPDHPILRARTSDLCLSIGVHAKELAGQTIVGSGRTLETVQALIILCEYPVYPSQNRAHEDSWFLSGLAVQLALSLGLHRPHFADEFRLSNSDPKTLQERTLTWAQCFIVHQSIAGCLGFPACVSDDYTTASASHPPSASSDLITVIYEDVAKVLRIQRFNLRLCTALGNNIQSKSGQTEAAVGAALISVLSAELLEMEKSLNPMSPLVLVRFLEAQLQLHAYSLTEETARTEPLKLLACYTTSIRMVEACTEWNAETNGRFWPRTAHFSLVLAALCLLKLIRLQAVSPHKFAIDRGLIQKAIMQAYAIIKDGTIKYGDEVDKISSVIRHLSQRITSQLSQPSPMPEQGKTGPLIIRSRMSLGSLLFESVVQTVKTGGWKYELKPEPRPVLERERSPSPAISPTISTVAGPPGAGFVPGSGIMGVSPGAAIAPLPNINGLVNAPVDATGALAALGISDVATTSPQTISAPLAAPVDPQAAIVDADLLAWLNTMTAPNGGYTSYANFGASWPMDISGAQ